MKKPTVPLTIWIDGNSLCYIGKDGHKYVIRGERDIENYSEVNNSVYPHSGQEKTSKSLP